jgi:hypothetical protein
VAVPETEAVDVTETETETEISPVSGPQQ